MFLKISREDFSWSRSKRALPVFLLLWAGGILLALTYLLSIRIHLHSIERGETERLLDSYLAAQRGNSRFFGGFLLQHKHLPRGLSFLRIVQGDDQMLVVGERAKGLDFKGLASFPANASGVWIQLGSEERGKEEILTVITRQFDGTLVQVGKDGQTGYKLFQRLTRNTVSIALVSIVVLWPLSLYFIRLSISPLVATRRKIAELVGSSKTELLPEKGSGPELDSLYGQINQLLQHNRHLVAEMQQSLDNVAHDLRTPMTRLRSVAEYGLQAADDTERLGDALSDCLEESERVLAMLNIMMSVAEAESGTMRLELQGCDLGKTLEQAVTLYEYVAEEKNIEVSFQSAELPMIRLDQTRIFQVWANLLDNAIKYGHEGGWVKISTGAEKDRIVVVFEDNGIGISASEQSRIWERLYRGDRSRSEKGLGLGLNYAQAVVAAHGGTVSVKSSLHKGSVFEVRLPVRNGS